MKGIHIIGIIIAVVVTLALDVLSAFVVTLIVAATVPLNMVEAAVSQTNGVVVLLVAGTMTTMIGGIVCAMYGSSAPFLNATLFGIIGVAISLKFAAFDPPWVDFVGLLATIPAALLGALLVVVQDT